MKAKIKKFIKKVTIFLVAGVIIVIATIAVVTMKDSTTPTISSATPTIRPTRIPTIRPTPTSIVYNSAWDGSVYQVTKWLRANLKDPKSLDVMEWSPVIETDTGFMCRVKYRAKNSFGGYVIEEKLFTLNTRGAVTGVADW